MRAAARHAAGFAARLVAASRALPPLPAVLAAACCASQTGASVMRAQTTPLPPASECTPCMHACQASASSDSWRQRRQRQPMTAGQQGSVATKGAAPDMGSALRLCVSGGEGAGRRGARRRSRKAVEVAIRAKSECRAQPQAHTNQQQQAQAAPTALPCRAPAAAGTRPARRSRRAARSSRDKRSAETSAPAARAAARAGGWTPS